MPVGVLKNKVYGLALPFLGKPCKWNQVFCEPSHPETALALGNILKRRHAVGAVIQIIRGGALAECYFAGNARLTPVVSPAAPDTLFRTASVAKLAAALLTFRLQTLGKLDVREDVSDFLGYPVRNPNYHGHPITLGMLLSHTSSLVDSPAYFSSLSGALPLCELLQSEASFSKEAPGMCFRYSNLAAGIIGSALEARFAQSLESLAQEYLFDPLGAKDATFDLSKLDISRLADSYRVLPADRQPSFSALARYQSAVPLSEPMPERHYLLTSGNLLITARDMGKLLMPLLQSSAAPEGFLSAASLLQMKTPLGKWPEDAVSMGHGMGLLRIDDPKISGQVLYGHQGFAYGAVNGCFFSENGDGFVSLNSGASEERLGHASLLNRDLIQLFLP